MFVDEAPDFVLELGDGGEDAAAQPFSPGLPGDFLYRGEARDLAERGRKEARALWRMRAKRARELNGDLASIGFRSDGEINLGLDDGHAAFDLKDRTTAGAAFPADALPDDETWNRLIEALIVAYDRWVVNQNKGHISSA